VLNRELIGSFICTHYIRLLDPTLQFFTQGSKNLELGQLVALQHSKNIHLTKFNSTSMLHSPTEHALTDGINKLYLKSLWGSHFILPIRLPSASITQQYTVNEVFTLCFTLIYYYNVNLRENFWICSPMVGKWGSVDVCASSAGSWRVQISFCKVFLLKNKDHFSESY